MNCERCEKALVNTPEFLEGLVTLCNTCGSVAQKRSRRVNMPFNGRLQAKSDDVLRCRDCGKTPDESPFPTLNGSIFGRQCKSCKNAAHRIPGAKRGRPRKVQLAA